eukprot:3521158-Pyramimonas_sp.AAC.1
MMGALHSDRGWAPTSIMIDVWKAFEQVVRGNLLQARVRRDFPLWLAKLQISRHSFPRVVSL